MGGQRYENSGLFNSKVIFVAHVADAQGAGKSTRLTIGWFGCNFPLGGKKIKKPALSAWKFGLNKISLFQSLRYSGRTKKRARKGNEVSSLASAPGGTP